MSNKLTIEELIERQIPWSLKTFGTGKRTMGITKHIEKELQEIREQPDDLMEWVDVILLAMDGAWRSGYTGDEIANALELKQGYNQQRKWPKAINEDDPVEHVRDTKVIDAKLCTLRVKGNPFYCTCGEAAFKPLVGKGRFECSVCHRIYEYNGDRNLVQVTKVISSCDKCASRRSRAASESHLKFWEHLKAGGHIFRDDPLNHVQELLTPELVTERKGCLCGINDYGCNDLTIIPLRSVKP